MRSPSIVWLRQDLRIHDHPAFAAAAAEGPVVPVYILDDVAPGRWRIGGAQRWWLHHSLVALGQSLERLGSRLILRRGDSLSVLGALAEELGIRRVHANQHHEPWWQALDTQLAQILDFALHEADVLVPVEQVRTNAGRPYKIYTPYWRALQDQLPPADPISKPSKLEAPQRWPQSDQLPAWGLLPSCPNWAIGFNDIWIPGEPAARERLKAFVATAEDYAAARDMPSEEGTSRFSPHLHFGELSPRDIWHALPETGGDKFRKELAWRDFARNVSATQPGVADEAGRLEFRSFPWRTGPEAEGDFRAWTRGMTGYPIVDAGMRQLWITGWMHNRVRMITASFLVKHLLIDWQRGFAWFWDTLVDADYGNNAQNWQWIAGSGIHSQPFIRIMSPMVQSRRFDAGNYIRRWVPELAGLSDAAIHDPWADRPQGYSKPIVDHRTARARALSTFNSLDGASTSGGA